MLRIAVRLPDEATLVDTENIINEIGADLVAWVGPHGFCFWHCCCLSVDLTYRPLFSERRGIILAALPTVEERAFPDARQLLADN